MAYEGYFVFVFFFLVGFVFFQSEVSYLEWVRFPSQLGTCNYTLPSAPPPHSNAFLEKLSESMERRGFHLLLQGKSEDMIIDRIADSLLKAEYSRRLALGLSYLHNTPERKTALESERESNFQKFSYDFVIAGRPKNFDSLSTESQIMDSNDAPLQRLLAVSPRSSGVILIPSWQLEFQATASGEMAVRKTIDRILSDGACSGGRLFLDMGANEGMYAHAAATAGCKVHTFEPQYSCVKDLLFSLVLNTYHYTPVLHHAFVSNTSISAVMNGIDSKCDGGENSADAQRRGDTPLVTDSVKLDDIVNENVLMWHIDAEGSECFIVESAGEMSRMYNISNVIIEVTTDRWSKFGLVQSDCRAKLLGLFERQKMKCKGIEDSDGAFVDPVLIFSPSSTAELNSDYWCTNDPRFTPVQ